MESFERISMGDCEAPCNYEEPVCCEENYESPIGYEEPNSNVYESDLIKPDSNWAKKAVLSISGGMDSTCLLMELLAQGIEEVRCLSFDYGQRHKVELKRLQKNIKFLQGKGFKVSHEIINLKDVFKGGTCSLTGQTDVPEGHYAEESMKSTVVPNRNIVFSSIVYARALAWANEFGENVYIAIGIHSGDHFVYLDCRPESQNMAKELFRISNWGSEKVDYIAPFVNIDKGRVLVAGLESMKELGFKKSEMKKVLKNTNTCYKPNEDGEACGKCGSCRERLEAMEFARGLKQWKWLKKDPAPYVDGIQ